MKTTKTTIDKITESFDKELRNLLLTDLKIVRLAKKNNERLLLIA